MKITMKATHNATRKTSFKTNHRKENKCFFSSLVVIDASTKPHPDGTAQEPVCLRVYSPGGGGRVTACLWTHAEPVHAHGSGSAGGGGYHKASAAAAEAIRNAGFDLSADIAGRGDGAMIEAVLAVAKCLGVKRPLVVKSHA